MDFQRQEVNLANAFRRREQRLAADSTLKQLMSSPDNVYFVHYICESLSKADGTLPRVIAIVLRNLGGAETKTFSIHIEAEEQHIGVDPSLTPEQFDNLERAILRKYFQFIKSNKNHKYVHWKMRDSTYGFQALELRYRSLKGNPFEISPSQLFDLSEVVKRIYGPNYTKTHPHLIALVKLNGITDKDLIPGREEPAYFDRGEYRALHNSAQRKISVIAEIFERTWDQTLKTDATNQQIYGWRLLGVIAAVRDNPWFALLEAGFAILGIVGTIVALVQLIAG